MIYEMGQIWTTDMKSNEAMILQLWTQFLQLRKEAWKIQDFNGVWTRDLAIPVRRSNQLRYEATDVGSWSFLSSSVPVRNESTMTWYMKWIIYSRIIASLDYNSLCHLQMVKLSWTQCKRRRACLTIFGSWNLFAQLSPARYKLSMGTTRSSRCCGPAGLFSPGNCGPCLVIVLLNPYGCMLSRRPRRTTLQYSQPSGT